MKGTEGSGGSSNLSPLSNLGSRHTSGLTLKRQVEEEKSPCVFLSFLSLISFFTSFGSFFFKLPLFSGFVLQSLTRQRPDSDGHVRRVVIFFCLFVFVFSACPADSQARQESGCWMAICSSITIHVLRLTLQKLDRPKIAKMQLFKVPTRIYSQF